MNILLGMYLGTRMIPLKFGTHPYLNPDLRIFLKYSSTLQDRAFFHTLAHISGKNDRILTKILPDNEKRVLIVKF